MTFLAPLWLLLGVAAAVVIFVLQMRRRRQFHVPSVLLWRLVESGATPRRALRWPPPNLLLFLQILFVLLVAIALAQPLLGAQRGDLDHTIYVIDTSASMQATDAEPSRFDSALDALQARIRAMPEGTGAQSSIISATARPNVEVARQTDPDGILAILDRVEVTDGPVNWVATADLIGTLIGSGEAPRIVVLTDGADNGLADLDERFPDFTVDHVLFGDADTANVGLLATLGDADEETGERQLAGTVVFAGEDAPESVTVRVSFRPDGAAQFVSWAEIEVERPIPDEDQVGEDEAEEAEEGEAAEVASPLTEVSFEESLALTGGGTVLVELPDDAGPADNAQHFLVRDEPVLARILYLGVPTRPLVAALQSFDTVELLTADGMPSNTRVFDLVIVDNVTVPAVPDTNVLWLGTARVSGAPVPNGIPSPTISNWNETHPLVRDVNWAGFEPELGYRVARMQGATVLLGSGDVPLVQARTTPHGREVRLGFDIATSGWTDQAGFPVFVASLIDWLQGGFGTDAPAPCRVGEACPIEARLISGVVTNGDGDVVWSARTEGADYLISGIDRTFVPARAGLYQLAAGDEVRTLLVAPGIAGEISLTRVDEAPSASLATASPNLWWWVLLLAFAILIAETVIAGRGPEQFLRQSGLSRSNPLATRRRAMLAARTVSILFIFAAIVGVPWLARVAPEDTVVVMSSALGGDTGTAERERILNDVANGIGDAGARGGVIAAGNETGIATDIGGEADNGIAAAGDGANLEEAALLAAAMVGGDRDGRIVLATDGNETEGELALAVAALAERGLTVDIQPLTDMPPGEVLVEQITAPPRVYEGDSFYLEAVIYSQRAGTADITITRAGEIVFEQPVELLAGRTMVETIIPAGDAGTLLIEVSANAEGDTYDQNNTNGLIVEVEPPPAIAIITPQPPLGEYFEQALSVQGLTAEILTPEEAPTTLDGWLEYESVVLMNVPAIAFDTDNQEYLEQLVSVYGRGLLILGGENSFGPGGYFQTPLEDLSPLSARIPHEASQVAMVFVLDRSGSMNAPVGDVTRLDIAKQATVTAVSLLNPGARVAVIVFDSQATLIVPLTDRRDEALVGERLGALVEGGGTNMYPGLAAAVAELQGVDAATKHIVVMTDGITNAADFPPLIEAAVEAGITISAVGIGAGADDRRLTQIAEMGGGTYHATGDFRALPAILSQEALMLANSPFEEEIAPVAWADRDADYLAGLPDELPPVYAYVRTSPKPDADIHLTLTDSEGATLPLMASWRYGNGYVLALATHGAGAGTADWIQMPEYPLMWSQVIRHFLPDAHGAGLHLSLDRVGDQIAITANLLDPEGIPMTGQPVSARIDGNEDRTIALQEIEPGIYRASVPVGTGAHQVVATAGELTDEASLYVAYPARFNFGRADFDKLQALAAATGGQVLLSDEPVLTSDREWVSVPGWRIWAVADCCSSCLICS